MLHTQIQGSSLGQQLLWGIGLVALVLLHYDTLSAQDIDAQMRGYGLIEVKKLNPCISVDLRYATADNFVGKVLYKNLRKAYLEQGFAKRIARAQTLLTQRHPGYRLLIYDAARPISVQREMYAQVSHTPLKVYVANGARGGRHNYGVAVDITIADTTGKPLDMGTDFDFFGEAAHTGQEAELVRRGLITPQALHNRDLLKSIMKEVGLVPYRREWWHYEEPISMPSVRKRYRLLNF